MEVFLWRFFLLLLIWAPLPLGSNRLWASQLLVLGFTLIFVQLAYGLLVGKLQLSKAVKKAYLPLSIFVVTQVVVFIQFVPGFSVLSPVATSACADLLGFGLSAASCSASIVPEVTFEYWLLGIMYCMVFFIGLQLINSRERIKALSFAVI